MALRWSLQLGSIRHLPIVQVKFVEENLQEILITETLYETNFNCGLLARMIFGLVQHS